MNSSKIAAVAEGGSEGREEGKREREEKEREEGKREKKRDTVKLYDDDNNQTLSRTVNQWATICVFARTRTHSSLNSHGILLERCLVQCLPKGKESGGLGSKIYFSFLCLHCLK